MSRKPWRGLAQALALASALIGVIGGLVVLRVQLEPAPYSPTDSQELDAANRYRYQPGPGCTPQELGQIGSFLEREAERRNCANEAQDRRRELDDLTQQTRAAEGVERSNWFARANLNLSYFQLFLSALGAAGLFAALWLNHQANAIARTAYVVDQRPWVHIGQPELTEVRVWPSITGGSARSLFVEGRVPFTNTGKTPALSVLTICEVVEQWSEQLRQLAAETEAWPSRPDVSGHISIAPGQTYNHPFSCLFDFEASPGPNPTGLMLCLFTAAGYSARADDQRKLTTAIYFVSQDQDVRRASMMGLQIRPDHLGAHDALPKPLDIAKIELRLRGGPMT